MNKRSKLFRLLIAALLLPLSNLSFSQRFSKLVVFGDSLSGTGNIAAAMLDFPFPFFDNRISNGPVLVDFVGVQVNSNADAAEHLAGRAVGFNYAVAGGSIVGSDRKDLGRQIDAYLDRLQGEADSQALYFIFIGGNDLRDIRSVRSLAIADERITVVLDALTTQVKRLARAGATTFLLPNVPNIGRIPETIQRVPDDPGGIERANQYSQLYNQRLSLSLAELRREYDIGITEFDLFTQFEQVFSNAAQLGFTQTEVGCFTFDSFSFQAECGFGTRFDRFVFFDNIHPSARTNESINSSLTEVVPDGPFDTDDRQVIVPILQLLLD